MPGVKLGKPPLLADTVSARTLVPTVDGETMTTKEKAISAINSLSDDATLDDVIDRLYLLRKIELGIAQADAGDVTEHEEFVAELEREDAS